MVCFSLCWAHPIPFAWLRAWVGLSLRLPPTLTVSRLNARCSAASLNLSMWAVILRSIPCALMKLHKKTRHYPTQPFLNFLILESFPGSLEANCKVREALPQVSLPNFVSLPHGRHEIGVFIQNCARPHFHQSIVRCGGDTVLFQR